MRCALALLAGAAIALAGCSGGGGGGGTTQGATTPGAKPPESATIPGEVETAPPSAPDAVATLRLFIAAAAIGDKQAMWALLSKGSRERFGPTFQEFEKRGATGFEEGLGSFARANYAVLLSVEPSPEWAVVAIAGERTAEGVQKFASYAAAFRPEADGSWRLEVGSSVELTPIIPGTSFVSPGDEVAVQVTGDRSVDEGGLWLDGRALKSHFGQTDQGDLVIAAPPDRLLEPGPHVAVVFARAGDQARAQAWTLLVKPA